MFIDRAEIWVQGGDGGDGAVSFRRESGVPRGGPDGGNGGDGGDVVLFADPNLDTLLDFRYRDEYRAGRGGHGSGKNRTGANGEDRRLPVPPGTVVRDLETGDRIGELLEEGDEIVVAHGGRGGRGNASFATSTRQAPREREFGREGERRRIELELKLIADVGLVGEPNAGKSTFLSVVSAAHPKVAEYPFTTLEPNLGVVQLSGGRSFVVADIPGIIEGAHTGKGLGTQFLRHIERTRTLALMVPIDSEDLQASYDLLRGELKEHDAALSHLPHCVIVTKADLVPPELREVELEAPDAWGTFLVSSVTGVGLDEVKAALWERVRRAREAAGGGPEDEDRFPELEEWVP